MALQTSHFLRLLIITIDLINPATTMGKFTFIIHLAIYGDHWVKFSNAQRTDCTTCGCYPYLWSILSDAFSYHSVSVGSDYI